MRPLNSTITEIVEETPSVRTFFLDTSFDLFPGKFVMVWVRGVDEKPMALSYNNAFTAQKVGETTSSLFSMDTGDSVGMRGPLGNGFELIGDDILIIAGGVGAVPLAPLAEAAGSKGIKVTTLIGAFTKKELIFVSRFRKYGEVLTATDDGTEGYRGFVTGLIEGGLIGRIDIGRFSQIYACGPEPMMAGILNLAKRFGFSHKIQFSLHRYFKCGIGLCGSCCIDGLRVCKDGPVFTGTQLEGTEFGQYRRDASGARVKI